MKKLFVIVLTGLLFSCTNSEEIKVLKEEIKQLTTEQTKIMEEAKKTWQL